FGDVTHEAGENPPVRQPDFAHGKVHWKNRAVFAPPDRFASDADDVRVTGAEIIADVSVMLLAMGRGHQDADVFADDFARLVTKNLFRRPIEGLDGAALVNRDNAFDRGCQYRAQPLLAVAQRGRGPLLLRPRARGVVGFEFLNPSEQLGSGHFPVTLHFKDEGNIGKSGAAANLKRVTCLRPEATARRASGRWRGTSDA